MVLVKVPLTVLVVVSVANQSLARLIISRQERFSDRKILRQEDSPAERFSLQVESLAFHKPIRQYD